MTPEEQQALVQFFGTVHAQAKQADQMIVQHAKDLKPVSSDIQNQLQQALIRQQVQNQQHQQQQQPQYHVAPEQAFNIPAPAMHPVPETTPAPQQSAEQQLELFSFSTVQENVHTEKIIKRLTETASYLYEIKTQLKVITEILEKNSIQLSVNDKATNKNKIKE
jgi:hypothetical protein